MPNRRLSPAELATFGPLLEDVRNRLLELSSGDAHLHWALRRKLAKELVYDERGKPMQRRALKAFKRGEQGNRCALCTAELPTRGAVLDRIEAMQGYTEKNTRLVCAACDIKTQAARGFA